MKEERGKRKEKRGERKKNNGRVLRAQPSSNQKTIFYKKSIFIKCRATLAKEPCAGKFSDSRCLPHLLIKAS